MRWVVVSGRTDAPFRQRLSEAECRKPTHVIDGQTSITFLRRGPKIRLAATNRSLEHSHAADCGLVALATGLVVVGDLVSGGVSQEQGMVGDTPNVAALAQGMSNAETDKGDNYKSGQPKFISLNHLDHLQKPLT